MGPRRVLEEEDVLPQNSVFFHRAQWQTVGLKWILLMPVGFYCLFDLHRHPAPGTAQFVIQNNADTADRTDLTYSQGLSHPPPLHIRDGFPCQLPMLSLKGSRAEELRFSDAGRGCSNLSHSPCTHKIGETRGRVGRREEKQIVSLFLPHPRQPSETTL